MTLIVEWLAEELNALPGGAIMVNESDSNIWIKDGEKWYSFMDDLHITPDELLNRGHGSPFTLVYPEITNKSPSQGVDDDKLGRWRDPEHPHMVVYPEVLGDIIGARIKVLDESIPAIEDLPMFQLMSATDLEDYYDPQFIRSARNYHNYAYENQSVVNKVDYLMSEWLRDGATPTYIASRLNEEGLLAKESNDG